MKAEQPLNNNVVRVLKGIFASLAIAMALSFGFAASASAQQTGLVNVIVEDVDLGVIANVSVPVGVAANVCGVNANVLAANIAQTGDAECTADAEAVSQNRAIQRFL